MVFTDEKRFCLDGPDDQAYFWSEKRLQHDYFSKHQKGCGGLMVWDGILRRVNTKLVFVSNTLGAVAYSSIINEYCQPFLEEQQRSLSIFYKMAR